MSTCNQLILETIGSQPDYAQQSFQTQFQRRLLQEVVNFIAYLVLTDSIKCRNSHELEVCDIMQTARDTEVHVRTLM